MNDLRIIQDLIERDAQTTEQFFFKDCRPLFASVIRKIFDYDVDYDEFVSEFYLYLMENDAARLRRFKGRSSIYQWLKVVAIRYFLVKKSNMIDCSTGETPQEKHGREEEVDSGALTIARMDVTNLLDQMTNPRHVYVIRRLMIDDMEPEKVARELNVTVGALYNIKKRALAALTTIALKS